ncbi:MAG: 3'(2'),5'-bisphosphate nucleotidase CysQ [Alsobacter sp.]
MSTAAGPSGSPERGAIPAPAFAPPLPAGVVERLGALAVCAGGRILEHYSARCVAKAKSDGSLVTEADVDAEAIILAGLPDILPGIPVVSEEAAAAGIVPQCDGTFVLVDPLDGTREYVSRNGEFTVNIAVVSNGRPVLGVVYAPVSGKLWLGDVAAGRAEAMIVQAGAPLSQAGSRHAIRARKSPETGLVACVSRSHCDPATDAYLADLPVGERREAGSSVKFCLIAEGEADLYPRFGPTMQWDTAAGHAILAAAGGSVTCPDGSALPYGHREGGFRNGAFIARGAT